MISSFCWDGLLPIYYLIAQNCKLQCVFAVLRGLSEGSRIYLSHVSEGMGSLSDWEMIMKHQRKNGSLFNLPSTSAAALTHLQNAGCLRYLKLVLEKFGDAGYSFAEVFK